MHETKSSFSLLLERSTASKCPFTTEQLEHSRHGRGFYISFMIKNPLSVAVNFHTHSAEFSDQTLFSKQAKKAPACIRSLIRHTERSQSQSLL